jgi:hypothetical protein
MKQIDIRAKEAESCVMKTIEKLLFIVSINPESDVILSTDAYSGLLYILNGIITDLEIAHDYLLNNT